jgi:hypothetical protein
MWNAYVEAAKTSNYQSPQLTRYSGGGARSLLVRGLRDAREHGIVTLGVPTFKPKVVALAPARQPTRADVKDCADSSHWLTYDWSGRVVGDRSPGRRRVEARLRRSSGTWKVIDLVVEKEGTC